SGHRRSCPSSTNCLPRLPHIAEGAAHVLAVGGCTPLGLRNGGTFCAGLGTPAPKAAAPPFVGNCPPDVASAPERIRDVLLVRVKKLHERRHPRIEGDGSHDTAHGRHSAAGDGACV